MSSRFLAQDSPLNTPNLLHSPNYQSLLNQAPMSAPIPGLMPGPMPGPMPGHIPGPMPGPIPGPMLGPMPGPMPGTMPDPSSGLMPASRSVPLQFSMPLPRQPPSYWQSQQYGIMSNAAIMQPLPQLFTPPPLSSLTLMAETWIMKQDYADPSPSYGGSSTSGAEGYEHINPNPYCNDMKYTVLF